MKLRVIARRHTAKSGILKRGDVVERDKKYLDIFPGVFEPFVPEIHTGKGTRIVSEGHKEKDLLKSNRVNLEKIASELGVEKPKEYLNIPNLTKAILAAEAGEDVPEPKEKPKPSE